MIAESVLYRSPEELHKQLFKHMDLMDLVVEKNGMPETGKP